MREVESALTKRELMRPGLWSVAINAVTRSTALTHSAYRAYVALGSFLLHENAHEVYAAESAVAEAYGVSTRTWRRDLRELENARLILAVKSGRNNRYIFLDPQQADLGGPRGKHKPKKQGTEPSAKKAEKRTEPSAKNEKQGTEPSAKKAEKRTEPSAKKRTEPSAFSGDNLITEDLPEDLRKERNAKARFLVNCKVDPLDPDVGDKLTICVAFLSKFFSLKTCQSRLRNAGINKVLAVKREFEAKETKVNNPAGLITHMLKQAMDPAVVVADSNLELHLWRKGNAAAEDRQQRARENRESKRKSILEWLNGQEDKDELTERAKKHAEEFSQNADTSTVLRTFEGFLWKERKKRDRAFAVQ